MSLAARHCESSSETLPALDMSKAAPYLAEIPDWNVNLEEGELRKVYKFDNFLSTIRFVNAIAEVAEAENHHPDLGIHYNVVEVTLTTHAISGLSLNDFIVAAKIEKLPR